VELDGSLHGSPDLLAGRAVFAVAGLARPAALRETLEELGASVVGYRDLPDHHAFHPGEEATLHEEARRAGAETLVLTEKDAVRWRAPEGVAGRALALRVEARLDDPEAFLRAVLLRMEESAGWTVSSAPG
jgi:tetraacyldisaccharide 4'-kinase